VKLNKISKSFFINLDRRKDRLDHIYKNTPFFTEKFPAVDSKSLELTEEIKKLFPDDLYLKKKKSEIACAISHYRLWKQLVEDQNADNYLILEDDVVFEEGFTKFWNSVWSHSMPSDYSLIYLGGCQPYNKPSYHKALQPYNNYFNNVKKQDFFTKDDHYWHMNASSYVISKQCASLMCQWVEQKGFNGALDFFMINFVNKNKLFSASNKLFHLNPLMARQLHEENDNIELDKNSDIRFDEDRFTKEANSSYDVCFCCDSNLIEYAINPINALCQQNKNNNINIHFIYSGKESDLKYIEAFISNKPNISLNKYIVNELNIPTNETWRSIGHLSNATNLKLQIPEILKDISSVIYFDIDTIPYVNLSCFDKVSTQSCGIAMCQEIKNGWRTFNGSKGTVTENKSPIPFGDRVIGNSGVMVLDLIKLRQNNFTQFCLKEKSENNYNIPLTGGDQDLINIFCKCNFDVLPDELNILVSDQLKGVSNNLFKLEHCITLQENGVHLLKRDGVVEHTQGVLHFIGKDKPWNSDCLGSEFWRKFSIVNENTNLHKQPPIEIIDYFDIDCQLTKNNLCNIVKEIQDKKCNCNMLVFGLGKDSIIYDTVNKGYTLFVETNQAWIDLNQKIKNKILYTFPTNVQDSLPINKRFLNQFEIPDFITKTQWDIVLIDGPPGDKPLSQGRALPIYWSSHIAQKYKTTIFIDDCRRDLEKEYCNKFFTEINFQMYLDTERGEFRSYKPIESNTDLKTKQNEFIKLKNEWQKFQKYNFLDFVAKNLPKREVPQEKYTCYNPGQKIGIVSLYTPEISEYAIESEISIRDYAFKQGYTFHVYRDRLDKESHPNWSKSHAILNHFDNHETIVWMDSDTIIFNPNQKFENILSECVPIKKIIACEDIGANSMLNSGVIIFRNHKYTKNLIKRWRDFHGNKSELYSSGGDQEVFCDIVKQSDTYGNNRKIFPMSKFNTDPRLVDNETFIMHFMAYGNTLKSVFMRYWGSK
jgi:GR25 family glycosyltransferase involved in LPS biosynthesis/lipopolysaccharide biosynthesis glycosyltransferase